jgi:hypothetical protein
MKETTVEQAIWPSSLNEGDLLFAIVDGKTSEVSYLVYSSIERKASFVRDRSAWQKVGETFFEKLEDMPQHYVDDVTIDAIKIYDDADIAGKTVSILDISNVSDLGDTSVARESTVQEEVDGLIASIVIEEEQALAEALIEITKKHGKFNSDDMGVWAGYESAEENEHAEIGVKCANCILYEGGTSCKIIAAEVEPGGYCRFALIPDGVVTAAASKPAPKKDRIHGSKTNKPGSAAGGEKITFSEKTTTALRNKLKEHNKAAPKGRKVTLGMLKAVYRRGSGAFSSSHRPGKTRDQWAMARVNAYLKLLKSGSPSNPKYKQDNDLLPSGHPKASNSTMEAVVAAVEAELAFIEERLDIDEDALVAASKSPCWDGYKQVGMKKGKNGNMVPNCVPIDTSNSSDISEFQVSGDIETECPPATTDIAVNLTNRKKAIRVANYGPLNPQEPNEEYWKERAAVWSVTPEEAQNSLCGNCAMFSITNKIRQCIADGIAAGGSGATDAWDAIDTAELGYCEAFDFKCAASRTCDAWVTGGPITDDSEGKEEAQ